MARVITSLVLRSLDTVEVEPGIYEYEYTVIKNIKAEKQNFKRRFENNDSIVMDTTPSFTLSTVFPADKVTGELGTILHYVIYRGLLYEVADVEYYPPRIKISVGNISKVSLDELLTEGKSNEQD